MIHSPSVVILTSRGPRHSYFCRELAKHFQIQGIVVDVRYGFLHRLRMFLKTYAADPLRLIRTLALKKQLRPYELRDEKIEHDFFRTPEYEGEFPANVPVLLSENPNDEAAQKWISNRSPDVIAVFGTRLIQDPVLVIARYGALNIHTGLSPYYRGGQCTFWCLYENDPEHLGVTIHHLTQKIDGGDIVYTAHPELEAGDTVRSIECKLVRLGTEKMIRAVRELAAGSAPKTPQTFKGKLFLSKMFTLEKRLELEKLLEAGLISRWLAEKEKRGVLR